MWNFLKEWIKNLKQVWALSPLSKRTVNNIINVTEIQKKNRIIELWPGTWVITEQILLHKKEEAKFFAIEANKDFYKFLSEKYPNENIILGCASNICTFAQQQFNWNKSDCIISTLPRTFFNKEMQKNILKGIYETLEDWKEFYTVQYVFSPILDGHAFENLLKSIFSSVEKKAYTILNFFPCFVFVCKK